MPKLDRLARSVPDARAIGDSLAARGVRLSLGGSVYDPTDPMGKCFFNILTFAEFEVDLLRMRTREGMAIARAKGKLKGKAPKLSPIKRAVLLKLHAAGDTPSPSLPNSSQSAAPRSTANWPASTTQREPTSPAKNPSGEGSAFATGPAERADSARRCCARNAMLRLRLLCPRTGRAAVLTVGRERGQRFRTRRI